jgi:MraZ protein
VARFFGRYEHSLDDKGRLILPAKFRPHFEHGGFISQYRDGCLALWTPEEFDKQMRAMEESQVQGRGERNLARVWASGSQEVEIDKKSGRMAIAPYLREFAHLTGDVLVNGAIDRVELWNPPAWEQKIRPSEADLVDGD